MKIKLVLGALGILGCLICGPGTAPAAAPELVPHKRSVAIPVTIGGTPARSLQCMVTCGPSVPISALAFSPDGNTLAVGGYQEVLLWDVKNGKLSKRIGAGQQLGTVGALVFLKSGQLVVGEGTPHGSGAVRVFDVQTGEQTQSIEELAEVIYCLALSPDGKLLAAGGADRVVRVWSAQDKKLLATLKDHGDWILGLAFSRDGKFLVSASADRTARVWDVSTWQSTVKLKEGDAVQAAAFGPDGKTLVLAVAGPHQRSLRVRRTDNVRFIRPISTGAGMPLKVIWTGKANRAYVACSDGSLRAFDSNGRTLATLAGHDDWVYCVALSPDQTRLASGSGDGTVKLWNAADGKLVATLVQVAPRTDQWLVITAQGHLATSSGGAIRWQAENLQTPLQELTDLLQKPDIVQKVMAGEKVPPPEIK